MSLSVRSQEISLIIIGVVFLNIIISAWFIFFRKKVIMCRILKEYGDSWEVIKRKRVRINESNFTYKDKSYVVDPEKIIFKVRRGLELNYEQDKPDPITFKLKKTKGSSKLLKNIIKDETANKLFSRYKDKFYTIIIVALAVVALAIGVYSIHTFNEMNQRILQQSSLITELILNQSRGVIIR